MFRCRDVETWRCWDVDGRGDLDMSGGRLVMFRCRDVETWRCWDVDGRGGCRDVYGQGDVEVLGCGRTVGCRGLAIVGPEREWMRIE